MTLKQTPSDFIVEEILPSNFSVVDAGAVNLAPNKNHMYPVYRVEKSDIETSVALGHIAKSAGIKQSDIGYAGIKDRHAKTLQYITLPAGTKQIFLSESHLSANFIGFTDSPIQLGSHVANKFTITIRQILRGRVEAILSRANDAFSNPIPNYFDSQRFGSFFDYGKVDDGETEKAIGKNSNGINSIGLHVIHGEYEAALKLYLTQVRKSDPAHVKADKRAIESVWPKLIEAPITDRVFVDIRNTYAKTQNWQAAYERIPEFERDLHISAVSSYVWNESLKCLLTNSKIKNAFSVKYAAGTLLFGKSEKPLPLTLGERKDIVEAVCKRTNIPVPLRFDWDRPLFMSTQEGKVIGAQSDELAKRPDQMQKIILSFKLLPGSYATVAIKAILRI